MASPNPPHNPSIPPSSLTLTTHNSPTWPSAALQAIGARPRTAQRRPTKQASYELCNHAKAYLEGGQYTSGYHFLHNLAAAGTSISTPAQPYIGFIAPPAYIALASSLVVYPTITTKTHSKHARAGADAALHYLQCLHATIDGPAYSAVRKAFSFPEQTRRRGLGHRSAAASQSPEPGGDIEHIAGDAANTDSLWALADDFWHVVGWAFNCSIFHTRRWHRWKPWLTTMLDFLESDWAFSIKHARDDEANHDAILQDSLLWHYIIGNTTSPNRGTRRRIAKSIFATATPESLKEYPEIWPDEIAGPKRKTRRNQRLNQVDFETGEMGDYDSDQDIQYASDESSTHDHYGGPVNPIKNPASILDMHDAVEQLGGMDAVELRQRLVALVAQVAQALPSEFTTLSDLFDNILEDFIHLPTMTFKVLLSTSKMAGNYQLASSANLLLPLVSGTVPDYLRYEPTQEHFESVLLSLKGTTQSYAANAKISLLLEHMFVYMMAQDALKPTQRLRDAMERGIQARHSVYGIAKRSKDKVSEEVQAKALMEACSERLLGMLEVLELKAGMSPQPLQETDMSVFASFASGSSLSPPPDSDDSDADMTDT